MLTVIAWIIGLFLFVTFGAAIMQGLPLLVGAIVRGVVSFFAPSQNQR